MMPCRSGVWCTEEEEGEEDGVVFIDTVAEDDDAEEDEEDDDYVVSLGEDVCVFVCPQGGPSRPIS
jgi:hypothetical protein